MLWADGSSCARREQREGADDMRTPSLTPSFPTHLKSSTARSTLAQLALSLAREGVLIMDERAPMDDDSDGGVGSYDRNATVRSTFYNHLSWV